MFNKLFFSLFKVLDLFTFGFTSKVVMGLNAVVPLTPLTQTQAGVAGLTAVAYNKKLADEPVLGSVWDKLIGHVQVDNFGRVLKVPSGSVFLQTDTKLKGSIPHEIRIGLDRPYHECPRLGRNQNMLGFEENQRWKWTTLNYNEVKKSFMYWGWGVDANDQEYYNAMRNVTPKAKFYHAELRDQRIQEAICLSIERTLTMPPVNRSQQVNPHVFVCNTALGGQPVYHPQTVIQTATGACCTTPTYRNTYIERIGDALFAATNSGANPEFCYLDVEQLLALDYHCRQTLKMPALRIAGKEYRLFVVPDSVATWLANPNNTQSLGAAWVQYAALPTEVQSLPGVLGAVRNLLIVENLRHPTVTLGGADEAWTLEFGFMYPGNNDCRNMAAYSSDSADLNYVFDVGYVLGQNGLFEWIANALRYNLKESTEYQKINGLGTILNGGIQLIIYDNDTNTPTSFYHNGTCLVLMAKPVLVTLQ